MNSELGKQQAFIIFHVYSENKCCVPRLAEILSFCHSANYSVFVAHHPNQLCQLSVSDLRL